MHITPGSLDRVIEEDAATAARLEQAIDCPHAPIDRLAGIPAIAGARSQRNLLAGACESHQLAEIIKQTIARRPDLGGCFCQAELDKRVLGDARMGAEVYASLRLFA